MRYVLVKSSTLALLLIADRSAWSAVSACPTRLVTTKDVSTRALALVVQMLNAVWSTTMPYAAVLIITPEILSYIALSQIVS